MPIDLSRLKDAARPLGDRIMDFLRKAPSKAFSVYEIIEAVEGISMKGASAMVFISSGGGQTYRTALSQLAADGRVQAGTVAGVEYFAANAKEISKEKT